MISLTLDIEPVAKGRPRFDRRGVVRTPETTRRFERELRLMVRPHAPRSPILGAIKLVCAFYLIPPKRKVREYPTVKPDGDNLLKAVKDALNGIMWVDDAQVIECQFFKFYDWTARRGRIEITIEEME